jgi:signal transduction histidine kinase
MLRNAKIRLGLPRLIILFGLALSLPLGYLALRTYQGLEAEEMATLSFFSETLFDEIEASFAEVIRREEGRAIDAYDPAAGASPLARPPAEPYISGYFQNNPDGGFQTPLAAEGRSRRFDPALRLAELEEANRVFNRRRAERTDRPREEPPEPVKAEKKKNQPVFAEKYLDASILRRNTQARSLPAERERVQAEVTAKQAQSLAKSEPLRSKAAKTAEEARSEPPAPASPAPHEPVPRLAASPPAGAPAAPAETQEMPRSDIRQESDTPPAAASPPPPQRDESGQAPRSAARPAPGAAPAAPAPRVSAAMASPEFSKDVPEGRTQIEIAPLQSIFIDDGRVFVFRRILIEGQVYRQGFLLQLDAFLAHLAATHFNPQPMARFTRLRLQALDQGRAARAFETGVEVKDPRLELQRRFPPPFAFLRATLACENIPPSAGRATLNIALAALAGIFILGVGAIYLSARKIVDTSERQSRFVSSVTHELKTPLTNIRMYIEMLDQGMARDPEREQEYFRILDSEGARLSRLVTHVLELSKLEKQHRRPELKTGDFADVIEDVGRLMAGPLKQGGFELKWENNLSRPFRYDREIMVQVLANLIENSVKFGRSSPRREILIRLREDGRRIAIEVCDSGPGIPAGDLRKIFNDFYRSKDAAARAAGGTGIGLALVRRFIALLGGEVSARNNPDQGCTFTLRLPV